MVSVANAEFWENRYQQETAFWDLGQAAPPFVSLLQSATAPAPGRMAVLGCGRGYDALLFAAHGFEVIGFDFAPSAIAAATAQAEATGSTAKFYQQDIFALPTEFAHDFDYVLEHTCFCAISPDQRPIYANTVSSILRPSGELLGLFWTHSRPGGPPYGSTLAEIEQCFAPDLVAFSLVPVTNSIAARQGEEHLGRFRRQPSSNNS